MLLLDQVLFESYKSLESEKQQRNVCNLTLYMENLTGPVESSIFPNEMRSVKSQLTSVST